MVSRMTVIPGAVFRCAIVAVATILLCLEGCGFGPRHQDDDKGYVSVGDEVDLNQYAPFAARNHVARLDGASSLAFEPSALPRLDGATALYPLYSAFVQASFPKGNYRFFEDPVRCSTTIQAYQRLIDGKTEMIFVARPSQKQIETARARGLEFNLTPIGHEAFVFFVSGKNPVKGLTVEQVQDIYAGRVTDWQALGGAPGAIRAYQRPQDSGSQTMLQKIMEGQPLVKAPTTEIVDGMVGIIRRTATYRNYPDAMGYSFLFFATEMVRENEIRLLAINGVEPTRQTIRDGSYPFAADFYAVTIKGRETPEIDALIKWILSPQGQSLVARTGYVPVN